MTDALVRNARNGDQQAFAKLVEAYYRPIYGLAFSTVGNWQAAEEVAQDAFLVAWVNIAKLRTVEAFGAWLRRIARNLAFNWIRSEHYRRALLERHEVFETEQSQSMADANLARADALAETWTALEKLSPALREAVVLYYLEEKSIAQTAAVLGVTENSVKKRLQHARPQLRRYFEEQWKADMERERRRINAPEAGRRFMAGVALGPVSGLAGKLGTGAGLWEVFRGDGTGRLASLFSFDSAVVKPVLVALVVVAVSGAGLFWNAHRQSPASENAPMLIEASAAPAGAVKAAPAAKFEEKSPADKNSVREPEAAAASASKKEAAIRTVTVSGHVVDEEQRPIQKATITVVASGLDGGPAEVVTGFGGAGGAEGFSTRLQEATGGGGAVVSGSVVRSIAVGGSSEGDSAMGGGAVGGAVSSIGVPPAFTENPHEDTLDSALLDETRRFSGESASDGSFSIASVPDDGQLLISVDAPGYCLQGTIKAGAPTTDLTFTLVPGFSVEGRLLSVEGRPVADGLLQVTTLEWHREDPVTKWRSSSAWSCSPQDWAWRRTDGQGHFTLKSKDSGFATITVRSKSQGKATFQRVPVEPGAIADLRFPRQSAVSGRITRHDGAPAAGLVVLLTGHTGLVLGHDENGRTDGEASGPTFKATTDADGAYRIAGVDPQMRYTVGIFNKDMTPVATALDLEPLGTAPNLLWNYTLPRPIVVKGVATEQASGRPAAGATILCKAASEASESGAQWGAPDAQATTGPDGRFELHITTRSGNYVFGMQTFTGFQVLSKREVHDGDTVVLNLVLPGSWTRNFLVLDASGNPLSGASIQIVNEEDNYRCGISERTGNDGRVRVMQLTAGERVKCVFQYEGHEAESESLLGQDGMEFPEETIVIDLSK